MRVLAALTFLLAPVLLAQSRVLDDFVSVSEWQAHPSNGVKLDISSDQGREGRALRLDFDFGSGGGYAIARLPVALDLPENYELSFRLRAQSPVNTLELKLLDPTAENVWWNVHRRMRFPEEWTQFRFKKRNIKFAWGPRGGGEIKKTSAIEIVVVAVEGGKGTVWIDDLTFTPLPSEKPYDLTPVTKVSADRYDVDFRTRRELGGLLLETTAADYDVLTSVDGREWETVWRVRGGDGGRDYVPIREGEARYVRVQCENCVQRFEILPPAFSESKNAMFERIAADAPRGIYPRYLLRQQSYWTIVGAPADTHEALVGEDGAIDVDPIRFSIEPFLAVDDRLLTWADASSITQSLEESALPIPSVVREHGDVRLTTTAFTRGPAGQSVLWARYRVQNRGSAPRTIRLHLAIRPLQVNPSWQFLAIEGGAAEVLSIAREGDEIVVNGTTRIIPLTKPDSFGAARFDQGDPVAALAGGPLPTAQSVSDPFGSASGVMTWSLAIAPNQIRDVVVTVPFHARPEQLRADGSLSADRELDRARADWRSRLGRATIHLPSFARYIANTVRSNLAYILINADGPSIQPGSRSYDRSWIRDGSLTSAALLQLGYAEEVKQFIEWYAQHQRPDGYVPCCVGPRGADPVPEHDSHGQFIYAIKEYYDFTGDRAWLDRMWPHVEKAVAYIDSLRRQRMTFEYQSPAKRAFFGLVPESISHEGYSAKPMHSYWDNFFVLKGLKDATEIALITGRTTESEKFAAMRDEFRRNLVNSIGKTMSNHKIDYLPGSVELGDFDPTSTTIAINPVGELGKLPEQPLLRPFSKYWNEVLVPRINGTKAWDNFTPYEWRTVGTLVRLGDPRRAHIALAWFFTHVRPRAWNHWAEVVWRDPATPKFIGDMPHTWVGSDFIRSVLDMFVYERESDQSLVLAAAIPGTWIAAKAGVGVENLRTPYGPLTYSIAVEEAEVVVRIKEGLTIPPGGIVLIPPRDRKEIVIRELPAELRF